MYRNDPELVQACLENNQLAWNELVNRYKRLVYSIPLRNGFTQSDAEDIFQNVFTLVHRNLASLRNHQLLAAWLISITWRECQHMRKKTRLSDEIPETLEDSAPLPPEEAEILERRQMIRMAINQVGLRCQELLKALFFETPTPSYENLAMRLDIPISSIGPTRARCFKKLKDILTEMGMDWQS